MLTPLYPLPHSVPDSVPDPSPDALPDFVPDPVPDPLPDPVPNPVLDLFSGHVLDPAFNNVHHLVVPGADHNSVLGPDHPV